MHASRRIEALQAITADADTVRVVGALQENGVEPILLKGPVLGRLLYRPGELRPYRDIDLLVAPQDFAVAARILKDLGYVRGLPPLLPEAGTAWTHARRTTVDLHQTLHLVRADPARVWDVVRRDARAMDIAGIPVRVPGLAVVAMHLALHAAVSSHKSSKTVDDLERALATFPRTVWEEAAAVAAELGALDAFGGGLGLCPAGVELGSQLSLGTTETATMRLLRSTTGLARPWTIELLTRQPSMGAAVAAIFRRCFPPPSYFGLDAGRYRAARLVLAYGARLARLAVQLPGSLIAWARLSRDKRVGGRKH